MLKSVRKFDEGSFYQYDSFSPFSADIVGPRVGFYPLLEAVIKLHLDSLIQFVPKFDDSLFTIWVDQLLTVRLDKERAEKAIGFLLARLDHGDQAFRSDVFRTIRVLFSTTPGISHFDYFDSKPIVSPKSIQSLIEIASGVKGYASRGADIDFATTILNQMADFSMFSGFTALRRSHIDWLRGHLHKQSVEKIWNRELALLFYSLERAFKGQCLSFYTDQK